MKELRLDELDEWYREQLAEKSSDFREEAKKSYESVDRTLKDMEQLAEELLDESEDDDDESTAIATRFARKINEVVADFDVDEEITHESTEEMQEEIRHLIEDIWGAGARWIKRMDTRYKGIIKQLDRMMKELSVEVKKIGKLLYEYKWVGAVERIGDRIDTLRDLSHSREKFEKEIRLKRSKIKTAAEEYEEAKQEFKKFKESSNVADLLTLDDDADHLASVLRMQLNTLKKPVKKFLQHDTGVRVPPQGQKALNDYFEDPYEAIVSDPDGYPHLISGLKGLKEAVDKEAFPLKDRLMRRAVEEAEKIEEGALLEFQEEAKEIERKRREYADSDVYSRRDELKENVEEAKKNLEYHKNDLLRVRDDIIKQLKKVKLYKIRIEKDLQKAFGEEIEIKVGTTLEPLLKLCRVDTD